MTRFVTMLGWFFFWFFVGYGLGALLAVLR